jgi:hypothetical protein
MPSTVSLKGGPKSRPNATTVERATARPWSLAFEAERDRDRPHRRAASDRLTGSTTWSPAPPAKVIFPFESTWRSASKVNLARRSGSPTP